MRIISVFTQVIILSFFTSLACAGGSTAFTYQGRLLDAGEPANGTYLVQFRLFDDPDAGSQIGSTATFKGLSITDGLISVELDFGADAFDNTGRWLEVTVNGGAALAPRQPITRAPYAIQTRGIIVNEDQHVGMGVNPGGSRLRAWNFAGNAFEAFSSNRAIEAITTAGDMAILASNQSADGMGVFAQHQPSQNQAWLGTPDYGVYGRANDLVNDWAGYFLGNGYFSGLVGIGTTEPGYPLHVVGDGQPGMLVQNTGDSVLPYGMWAATDGLGGRAVYGVATHSAGSNYGVFGTSAGSNGTGVFGLASATSGVTYGVRGETLSQQGYGVYSNGDVCTTGSYLNCSDARFKQNIQPLADSLDKILKLRGVQFDWKRKEFPDHSFSQDRQIGFIAQEVAEVLPELVGGGEDKDQFYSVSYGRLVPVLVEAIKELNDEVEHKDSQITELQTRLTAIESLVEQLVLKSQGGAK